MDIRFIYLTGLGVTLAMVLGIGLPALVRKGDMPWPDALALCLLLSILWPVTIARIIWRGFKL